MRLFPVPMDLTEEEKVIGGVLSLRQVVYLFGGSVAAALSVSFLRLLHVPWAIAFPAGILWFIAGGVLSFAAAAGMGADEYLFRWFSWRFRRRRYDWGDEL
ncbi:MAG: PrgI family protein [Syntrophothermus sp.]|uniref:PrgI family mobile element protein n=1 Tax=Syntrophothermus sp. TaxID=2736299 RepID=UPI00257CB4E1|nr:PrgI family protein [Syntrophothermus sp.]NSW84668.1 PrgI family protein [Syntrophothermus sp.]